MSMKKVHYNKYSYIVILVIFIVFIGISCSQKDTQISTQNPLIQNNLNPMKITSQAFQNNTEIPARYTCQGENISPPLEISDVPTNTKSLALIVDDPDAPNKSWVHWVIWNISPSTTTIPENAHFENIGLNDFGQNNYGGPCPPSGIHRYFFKIYALDTQLIVTSNTNKPDLLSAMTNHILAQSELIGTYIKK